MRCEHQSTPPIHIGFKKTTFLLFFACPLTLSAKSALQLNQILITSRHNMPIICCTNWSHFNIFIHRHAGMSLLTRCLHPAIHLFLTTWGIAKIPQQVQDHQAWKRIAVPIREEQWMTTNNNTKRRSLTVSQHPYVIAWTQIPQRRVVLTACADPSRRKLQHRSRIQSCKIHQTLWHSSQVVNKYHRSNG